jgi:tape measure domain-containing protein
MTVGELTAYLDLDDKSFNRGLDSAHSKFSSFGSKIGGMAGMVGKVAVGAAVGGVAALGAGLVAGGVAGMKFNSSVEQTTIAMGTMLGSTAKAKALIADVTKMSAATPFEFPELADATKRLVAYGVAQKDVIPTMTRLGDISSALNIPIGEMSDLYGKMKVSGRISMEDINQMAGRGIPIYGALAKQLGVSQGEVRGLVEAGKVGFPDIEKSIVGMTEKGSMFGGMMDKQSRSFSGLWSTIKDGATQVFATAMKPLFTWLAKEAMPAIVQAMPQIQAVVTKLVGGIGGVFKVLGSVFGSVKSLFSGGGMDTSAFMGPIKDVLTNLSKLWDVIKGPVKMAASYLGTVLGKAFTYLKPLLVDFIKTQAKVIGYVVMLARFIKRHWAGIVTVVGPIFKILSTIISTAFKVIVDVVKVAMALIRGDWRGAWNGVKSIMSNVAKAIGTIVRALGSLVVALLRAAWAAVRALTSAAWGGIKSAVSAGVSAVVGYVKGLPGRILGALGSLGSLLYEAGRSIISGLLNGIRDALGAVWDEVSSIAGKIRDLKGPLEYDKVLLRPAGQAIIGGLMDGIDDQLSALYAQVGEIGPRLSVNAAPRVQLAVAGGNGAGGASRGTTTINVNVVVPGGTTLIGTAKQVGEIIAPHVARAVERSAARSARRR